MSPQSPTKAVQALTALGILTVFTANDLTFGDTATRMPQHPIDTPAGRPKAIAAQLNQALQPQGITVKAKVKSGCLHLILEADYVPHQQALMGDLKQRLASFDLGKLEALIVYARQSGNAFPAWTELVSLKDTDPAVTD